MVRVAARWRVLSRCGRSVSRGARWTFFLDKQSLGLRPFLEGKERKVRDVTEISGNPNTQEGPNGDLIFEYLKANPTLLLVTKDLRFAWKRDQQNLSSQLIYVNESEAVAKEVLRRLDSNLI